MNSALLDKTVKDLKAYETLTEPMTSPQTANWQSESKAAFLNSWRAVFADARFSPDNSDMFFFHTIQGRKRERGEKKNIILLRCAWMGLCVFKWLAIVCRLWTCKDRIQRKTHREREEREEGRRRMKGGRGGGGGWRVSKQLACWCAGVPSKALPPTPLPPLTHTHVPTYPPTHLLAHHQPYLTRSDTLSPRLRAPRLCTATHRPQSTAVCVCGRACVCACVCPSANSALSFSWIYSDCPRVKLTPATNHQHSISRRTPTTFVC